MQKLLPSWPNRCEAAAHISMCAILLSFVGASAVLTATFGAAFYQSVAGVPWQPVNGFVPVIVLGALQVIGSFVMLYGYRFPIGTAHILLGVVLISVIAGVFAPRWFPPLTNASDSWVPIVISGVSWGMAYHGRRGRGSFYNWLLLAAICLVDLRLWAFSWETVAYGLMFTTTPALLGFFLGYRKRVVTVLRDRAERAEREQSLLAEQARADERVRLAGEMHDVVTHRLSLMVLQAGALGVTGRDPETRSAAEELRAAGCQALEELRDLIGVLRSPADEQSIDEPANAPSLAELVADSRAVGLAVSFAERGDRAHVSPVVGRTAYRIVQEALTNVHKHAPGATAEVRVDYEREKLRLCVRNSRPAQAIDRTLSATGSGAGLDGLRRRVELVSGQLHSAATSDGGFSIDAVLPAYVPTTEAR